MTNLECYGLALCSDCVGSHKYYIQYPLKNFISERSTGYFEVFGLEGNLGRAPSEGNFFGSEKKTILECCDLSGAHRINLI